MTAAAAASKKRKLAPATDIDQPGAVEAERKRSPLFNQPQNYYAPPAVASMSKEELSEWRKEQRRKRNRESAAASRNKTRARIEELEGEVQSWKTKCSEMEERMKRMERHIEFLTKLSQQDGVAPPMPPASPPTVVSHPNSPPESPKTLLPPAVVPQAVSSSSVPPPPPYSSHVNPAPLVPLLSVARDCAAVETQDPAPAAIADAKPTQEPREHAKDKDGGEGEEVASDDKVGMEVTQGAGQGMAQAKIVDEVSSLESDTPHSSDDEDFLDLLVDTLDGEFDPELLI